MGKAKGIIGVDIKNCCPTKGITVYIYFNNHWDAFTHANIGRNLIFKFHNTQIKHTYVNVEYQIR